MDRTTLAAMARAHWATYLPAKTAELKAQGTLNEEAQAAATLAQREIDDLMNQGFQEHEAAEVALPRYVLLPPEAGAGLEPRERQELEAMERRFQREMRD